MGVFIYRFIKLIYLFFTGRNLKNELKEDEEVRKILEANKQVEKTTNTKQTTQQQTKKVNTQTQAGKK